MQSAEWMLEGSLANFDVSHWSPILSSNTWYLSEPVLWQCCFPPTGAVCPMSFQSFLLSDKCCSGCSKLKYDAFWPILRFLKFQKLCFQTSNLNFVPDISMSSLDSWPYAASISKLRQLCKIADPNTRHEMTWTLLPVTVMLHLHQVIFNVRNEDLADWHRPYPEPWDHPSLIFTHIVYDGIKCINSLHPTSNWSTFAKSHRCAALCSACPIREFPPSGPVASRLPLDLQDGRQASRRTSRHEGFEALKRSCTCNHM